MQGNFPQPELLGRQDAPVVRYDAIVLIEKI
jgi:hypothetical protein